MWSGGSSLAFPLHIHHLLKGGGCPMQAEGKGCVLPVPTMGTEGCILLCRQSQVDLPVSLGKIQSGDEPGRSVSSSTQNMGYPSKVETSFSFFKSLQNQKGPSGLG